MKRIVSILAVLVLFMALPACNTTKGVGKDIEKAGSGIKNTAEKTGAD